jgi:hypothetical protein
MKIRRFSEEHIVGILKEHEAGSWGRHPRAIVTFPFWN